LRSRVHQRGAVERVTVTTVTAPVCVCFCAAAAAAAAAVVGAVAVARIGLVEQQRIVQVVREGGKQHQLLDVVAGAMAMTKVRGGREAHVTQMGGACQGSASPTSTCST